MLCGDIEEDLIIADHSSDSSASLSDENLEKAYHSSLQAGTSLPLLKEELRLKIQHGRLQSGQEELVLDQSPPKPDLLTLSEVFKKNRRRNQNRESADRSRSRGKEYEQHLIETIAEGEKRMAELEQIRDNLLATKKMLSDVLSQHSNCSVSKERDSKTQKYISLLNSEWHR
ncbi:uncharacterized protein [Argopecten irradians]|uniref:uncharacterized protein n=1 Tax=Argopecten irradians TaxID=31199 RepID=UPI00371096C3